MPASTTTLTRSEHPGDPGGPAENFQASDVSPGNKFLNTPGRTYCLVRNTTGGALGYVLEHDVHGTEIDRYTGSVPANDTVLLGPFEPELNNHGTTEAASNGYVMIRQTSGGDGDLEFQPINLPVG